MKKKPQHFLSEIHCELESYSNESKCIDIEVLRVGTLFDRGLKITMGMLQDYVTNFKDKVYGQEISLNKDHTDGEACGWITDLYVMGSSLFARVELTKVGFNLIKDNLYKYVSAEFYPKYPRPSDGKQVNNVFAGLALTNTPAMKNQNPLRLSEQEYNLINNNMFKTFLESLKAKTILSQEDVKLAKTLLSELPEEEQAEHKGEVDALDAKVEADKAEAEKEATEKAKLAEKEANEKKELSERIAMLEADSAEKDKLAEKVKVLEKAQKLNELSAVADKVVLSRAGKVNLGFKPTDKNEVVAFLKTLSDAQVSQFVGLVGKMASVNFSEVGGAVDSDESDETEADLPSDKLSEKIEKEAKKLSEETKRDYAECYDEVAGKLLK